MLVVIGKEWLALDGATGASRIMEPGDFVRLEIETALQLKAPIIPVLVEGAGMPSADDLPESLRDLVSLNGVSLPSDPYFDDGIRRMTRGVEEYLPPGMRPRVRARRRAIGIGSALSLVLVVAIVVVVLRPVNESLSPHWDTGALIGAVVTGPAEGWVVGTSGTLLQVQGQRATPFQSPITDDLYAVAATSKTSGAWAVGAPWRCSSLGWDELGL